MKKFSISLSVKKIINMINNNEILFNHPIQRHNNQWNLEQKSLLVHSIIMDYPIPPVYSVKNVDGNYQILDGKQRLTSLDEYVNNGFELTDMPEVIINDEVYNLEGLLYKDLPQAVVDEIKDNSILLYIYDSVTDENIENIFFRLNNGVSLSKNQQSRAVLGSKLIICIDDILKLPFFKEKINFTSTQLKKSEDQQVILQTLMLITEYNFKKFSNDDILQFAEYLRGNHNQSDLDLCKNLFIELNEAFETKEKWLRKIHIPGLVMSLKTAKEMNIPFDKFKEWIHYFIGSYDTKGDYGLTCSQRTTNKETVARRLELIKNNMIEYITKEKGE